MKMSREHGKKNYDETDPVTGKEDEDLARRRKAKTQGISEEKIDDAEAENLRRAEAINDQAKADEEREKANQS